MDKTEIIEKLIEEKNLNVRSAAIKADIPYTTLRSMLKRGIDNSSVGNVIKLCKALDITIDELERMSTQDDISTIAAHHDGDDFTEEELEEIKNFKEFIKSRRNQ
ncbi:helix-turn-helix transcriptional regulator [Clostridium sp. D2Q-11]|uniref:Helix-turn-helix transcriptional regulator n=1 Tax=Anaeromonas frigoriresistens TaxID=2683708 RepID=A0A942UYZ6_9FIRM|nr:helix-turn-helix transcriptional regulator [Anaeromonas frigoriresistens]MBS4538182.1 helix-turn-helix transcriptional regulator [Anaeromonas frigoriresistens]